MGFFRVDSGMPAALGGRGEAVVSVAASCRRELTVAVEPETCRWGSISAASGGARKQPTALEKPGAVGSPPPATSRGRSDVHRLHPRLPLPPAARTGRGWRRSCLPFFAPAIALSQKTCKLSGEDTDRPAPTVHDGGTICSSPLSIKGIGVKTPVPLRRG